jgi:hypothetical protein
LRIPQLCSRPLLSGSAAGGIAGSISHICRLSLMNPKVQMWWCAPWEFRGAVSRRREWMDDSVMVCLFLVGQFPTYDKTSISSFIHVWCLLLRSRRGSSCDKCKQMYLIPGTATDTKQLLQRLSSLENCLARLKLQGISLAGCPRWVHLLNGSKSKHSIFKSLVGKWEPNSFSVDGLARWRID